MVLARSNRDTDLKQAVGNYELTWTPRALFAPNRSMLECHGKTDIIYELEAITEVDDQRLSKRHDSQQRSPIAFHDGRPETAHTESDDPGPSTSISQPTSPTVLKYDVIPETANTLSPQVRRIAVVDGMFVGKLLKKLSKVNTVKDVSTLFNSQLINITLWL